MRRRIAWIVTLITSLSAFGSPVAAEKPVKIPIGEIPFTVDSAFTPKKLPKGKLAPVAFSVFGTVKTAADSHPPALKEVVIEADRNSAIDARGLPVCTVGKLRAQDTENAADACPTAIVGRGTIEIEVARPEQAPFIARSKLLAFNRGVEDGRTTILVHAYLLSPESTPVLIRVEVSKIRNGRYGLEAIARIPKIADGYGSVRSFSLTLDRGYKNTPFLFAKCPDEHLVARGTAVFVDGNRYTTTIVRSCTATRATGG